MTKTLPELDLILNKNNFQFSGQHYILTEGVGMGSRVSPSLPILYMGDFKEKVCVHIRPTAIDFCQIHRRYMFMIWPHSLEELNTFIVHLNGCTESIWFLNRNQLSRPQNQNRRGKVIRNLLTRMIMCYITRKISSGAKTVSHTANS